MNNNNFIEIQNLLKTNKFSKLEILEMSILHTTTIILRLVNDCTNKTRLLECNYCQSFNGNLDYWNNTSLHLSLENEIITYGNRKMEKSCYMLSDRNNGFYIKFNNVHFLNNPFKKDNMSISLKKKHKNNIELIHELKNWKQARVRLESSKKGLIEILLDLDTYERMVRYMTENPGKSYILDTTDNLTLYCFLPTFLCAKFNPWEINNPLVLKDNSLQNESGNFHIKFNSIYFDKKG